MTNNNASHNAQATYAGLALNPRTAALLSIVPGLGQLYIGETRKSILYMAVAAANVVMLISICLMRPITGALTGLSNGFHMRVNNELMYSMGQLQFGSAVSGVVIFLFCLFVGYAMREAYDRAQVLRRKQIYPEAVIELSEATSGSYLFHISLILAVLLLTFFFILPTPIRPQITEIEFMQQDAPVKTPVNKTMRRDVQAHEDAGKHENRPITPAAARASVNSKPAQPSQVEDMPAPPIPHPAPQPVPHAATVPVPTVVPRPMPAQPQLAYMPKLNIVGESPAEPTAPVLKSAPALPTVAPTKIELNKSGAGVPMPTVSHSGASSPSTSVPGPVAASKPANPGAPVVGESIPRSHMPAEGGRPTPTRVAPGSQAGRSGPIIAIIPRLAGPGGEAREGSTANPDETTTNKGASARSLPNVDFGPYMADLQRRIKRAWFPPKNGATLRAVVIFTVFPNGELSNLKLQTSTGLAIADQAALKAVQNAAPFAHLPQGASDSVDIQFTFDYHVFVGN